MCAQAIVDPEELALFAGNLRLFDNQLRDSMARLQGQFAGLGDTWRDQEHQKFAEEFVQTMRVLEHFITVAEEHIPFLVRKAERAREYLQQH